MNCNEIRELMPDLAAGLMTPSSEIENHLQACGTCTAELGEFRRTMALLDEWKAPEPSPYFDVRLQARLREDAANQSAGWLQWFRKPAFAIPLMIAMVAGISLYPNGKLWHSTTTQTVATAVEPGTAVGDLQALDKNTDLYNDFDVLDDLQVQHDVNANQ